MGHACANCGAGLPPGAKFCGECGNKVDDPAARTHEPSTSPTSERRLVSVLFADLVGFTATSETRDPEEVRDFLNRYSELASDTVRRFGGTVDKFIGDGVMAIWGTPTAFEDDAERAVRAALDLTADVKALGVEFGVPELSMRAGVATGEAAVTVKAGSHGMVAGDLVNTASRLEGAAVPGTALVNDATKRSSEGAIAYEDAGSVALKGKTEEVSVWRPTGVIARRGGAGAVSGLEPPFVGRTSELHLVKELFKSTIRDGRAHLVSIQGIPGIGKSRLVWEFEKYLDGLAERFYWHQGRAPAYGDGVTFWSLGEMVRRRAGIVESDDEATTLSRVSACVDEHIAEDDKGWVSGALHALLGVGNPPSMDRDELFAAWRQFFQRMALNQPVVMVYEDLQWADHGTIDFVSSLLEWSRDYPIFIVTLSRPELLDRRENWGAGQRGFTGLHIEPLSPPEVEELLEGMVPGLPSSFKDQIVERSEGVPLYAVETVRMLLGEGHLTDKDDVYQLVGEAPELAVPETLHSLVAARLDTLEPDDRHLLQRASVLGQTFTVKALAELADLSPGEVEERLGPMVRREILAIEADPRSPERGQYRFVQGVIKEVAYSGIAKSERSALHVRVAELMTELGDEELAGVIASHYMDAYQALNARDRDESLKSRALTSLTEAAERASELGSNAQALGFYDQALDIVEEPSSVAPLALAAGDAAVLAAITDSAVEHFESAIAAAKQNSDQRLMLQATAELAKVLMMTSKVDEALDLLEKVRREDAGEVTPEWVSIHSQTARAHAFHGDGEPANELIDKALKDAATLGLRRELVDALITRGWALSLADRTMEGLVVTEGALASADRYGFHREAMRARNNMAAYLGWNEPAWVLDVTMTGYQEATRLGNMDDRGTLAAKALWGAEEVGDLALVDRLFDELGDTKQFAWFAEREILGMRARLLGYRGDPDAGLGILAEIEARSAESSSPQDLIGLNDSSGLLYLMKDEPKTALEEFLKNLELIAGLWSDVTVANATHPATWLGDVQALENLVTHGDSLGFVSERFQAALGLTKAALEAIGGETEQAIRMYGESALQLRALGLPFSVALAQLDRLTVLGPDHEGADEVAGEARRIWSDAGVVPFLEKLESVYPFN